MKCKVKPHELECFPVENVLNNTGEQPAWVKKLFETGEFSIVTPEGYGNGAILHTPYAYGVPGDMLVYDPFDTVDLYKKEEFEFAFEIIEEPQTVYYPVPNTQVSIKKED